MEHCPTCETRFRGEAICSRCGTDLSEVLAVEHMAIVWCHRARAALCQGHLEVAYGDAKRAVDIHRSDETVQVLALAALACRKFDEALALWQEIRWGG